MTWQFDAFSAGCKTMTREATQAGTHSIFANSSSSSKEENVERVAFLIHLRECNGGGGFLQRESLKVSIFTSSSLLLLLPSPPPHPWTARDRSLCFYKPLAYSNLIFPPPSLYKERVKEREGVKGFR